MLEATGYSAGFFPDPGRGRAVPRASTWATIERKRLFKIIEDLVLLENTTNEEVLERARAEIRHS